MLNVPASQSKSCAPSRCRDAAAVGAPLFDRGYRTISLSATGERLAPRLTSVFLDMERLLTETVAIDVDVLQVSTIQSFAAKWRPI